MKNAFFSRRSFLPSARGFALAGVLLLALSAAAAAFDCEVGQAGEAGNCNVPDDSPEVCELFRGTVTVFAEGRVCKDLDRSGTFCILGGEFGSSEVFPCRGLLNRARKCNLDYGRPLLNPFVCDAKCEVDEFALGGKCVRKCAPGERPGEGDDCIPERRVDLAHLREHCPVDSDENGISRAVSGGGIGPHLGEWCKVSRRADRFCYALAAPFADLGREDLENDNGELLSETGLYSCDEVLQFCSEGTRDPDGSHFTEGCLGEAVYRVDLDVLEAHCPEQPEENGIYTTDPHIAGLAGKWCELSLGPPYRYCYALKEPFHGYLKSRLETANGDNLSVVVPPLNLCDAVLRACPEGTTDMDGNPSRRMIALKISEPVGGLTPDPREDFFCGGFSAFLRGGGGGFGIGANYFAADL